MCDRSRLHKEQRQLSSVPRIESLVDLRRGKTTTNPRRARERGQETVAVMSKLICDQRRISLQLFNEILESFNLGVVDRRVLGFCAVVKIYSSIGYLSQFPSGAGGVRRADDALFHLEDERLLELPIVRRGRVGHVDYVRDVNQRRQV